MSLKLVIWDMDGTLVDSREVIQTAMVRAFEDLDLTPPAYEETRKIVGLGLAEACRLLTPNGFDQSRLPELVEAYKNAFMARRMEKSFKEPLYDGTLETLERLANEGWLQALATGKSHRGIRAIFEMHPIGDYFDTIWCADDGPGKPHPFMVNEAMGALGAEAHQSIMIGDAIHDIRMAKSANVRALGVSWGFGLGEELLDAGADELHHDFESLNVSIDQFGEAVLAGA
ncbi:MAG: HAD-IA family hydrolase [Pseudomonadota bacterium]